MVDEKETEFQKLHYAILVVTSIIFILLIWRMIPLDRFLKFSIFCVLGAFIPLLLFLFAEYLFKAIKRRWLVLLITVIVFLLCPLSANYIKDAHEQKYLASLPPDKKIYAEITHEINIIDSSGSIGSDWVYEHFFNKTAFESGDVVSISANVPFTITSKIIELDDISDVGKTTSQQKKYATNGNYYKKEITVSNRVHVEEKGGRKYAGSTADFDITYTLKRVMPPSMGYWDTFWYTFSKQDHILCVSIVACQSLFALLVIIVIMFGKIKQDAEVEAELRQKEKLFEEEKAAFIEKLQGRSIKEVARVPSWITFVNGLPKDNNDAAYGSFTVYCSLNGKCYHEKAGCCSASCSIHYFVAQKSLKPCSKCCTSYWQIPKWYKDYNNLKEQANKYELDVPE